MSNILPLIVIVVAALLAFVAGAVIAKRRGYRELGEVVARCRRGHLFMTVWDARFSWARLDLGWARVQRCPVGDHLSIVKPVDKSALTPEEKKLAKQHRDSAETEPRIRRRRPGERG